jgi:hypothetical protein
MARHSRSKAATGVARVRMQFGEQRRGGRRQRCAQLGEALQAVAQA